MPCNTAHYFLPQLQAKTETPFLSMLAATAKTCAAKFPGKTAAVLGTKGTLATGLYDRALEGEGVAFILPDEAERDTLMHLIYDVVKASKPLAPEQGTWEALLNGLRARGADYFILAARSCPSWPIRCRWKARSSTRRRSWRRWPSVSAAAKRWKTEQYSGQDKTTSWAAQAARRFCAFSLYICAVC